MQQVPQVTPIPRFSYVPKFQPPQNFQKPNNVAFQPHRQQFQQQNQNIEFDGKRLRKAVARKTVDYNTSVVKYLESRIWQRDYRDRRAIQPDGAYYTDMLPPLSMPDNPINAVTTKFVRTSTNKMRCPIFCVVWTPEGRRLITGASSGEFTLWNGLTFNFETILQAHDAPVRCMVWSHNDVWMVTGDHAGYIKYWQSNMNNVKMFQGHKEPLRGISFCPADTKFVTCSDDGTVRIWDFLKCFEEKILRGHGADVKCVDWHPQKSLIVSGSKDSQQPIKLWDPKMGQSLATIHAHKNTVMDAKWNKNGNWLLTASRDHLIKLFDIRNMSQEMQTFRGHKKEATTLAWHPIHEGLFSSGGSDGCVMFWVAGAEKEVGCMEQAHDSCVWSLAWHPLGHILCSGSNDHSSKFWTRNRPGDKMQDKYNLNTLPKGLEDAAEYDDSGMLSSIPGMGLEHGLPDHLKANDSNYEAEVSIIPGLDFTAEDAGTDKVSHKKIPFSKPIPKQFQQQWMDSKQPLLLAPPSHENIPHNGEMPMSHNPESMRPPQEHFQQNMRMGPPTNFEQHHSNLDQPPIPPPNSESHFGSRPPNNMNPPFPEQQHENFHHNLPPRNDHSHDSQWRSYSDEPTEGNHPPEDFNHPSRENGQSRMHNQEPHQGGFNPQNNHGPPPKRGRHSNPHFNEEEFIPDNMPSRGPPHFNDNRYPGNEMDSRNNHRMPSGPDERNYGPPQKGGWVVEGPPPQAPNEDQFHPRMDFDGPPRPQQDFNHPRHNMRPPAPEGNSYFRGRGGPRRPFRGGRSPFRIINRGRGRGGYQS